MAAKSARTGKPDPYDVLGVDREASTAEIKGAFRARAMRAHPDAGGSAEEFSELKSAQLLLTDAKRRARYDATGDIDEEGPDNAMALAFEHITRLLAPALNADTDLAGVDLIAAIREGLETEIKETEKGIRALHSARTRALGIKRRLHRKSKGQNMMARFIDERITQIDAKLQVGQQAIEERNAALKVLKDYACDVDMPVFNKPTLDNPLFIGTFQIAGFAR